MTDPTPAEPTKISRARATTSDVPRRASRSSTNAVQDGPASIVPKPVRAENVQIHQGGADHVEGDTVSVTQGGITSVNANRVSVQQGGIAYAQADDISVSMGGVALARADRIDVDLGGVGLAVAREAHVTQGVARTVIAQDVRLEQGLVGTMISGTATFARPSGVLMLIAGRVDGPVKALLDWRSALAFGAAFGVAWGIIRRR